MGGKTPRSAAALARAERRRRRREAVAAEKTALAARTGGPRLSFCGKARRGDKAVVEFHFTGGSFPFDPGNPSSVDQQSRDALTLLDAGTDPEEH